MLSNGTSLKPVEGFVNRLANELLVKFLGQLLRSCFVGSVYSKLAEPFSKNEKWLSL